MLSSLFNAVLFKFSASIQYKEAEMQKVFTKETIKCSLALYILP